MDNKYRLCCFYAGILFIIVVTGCSRTIMTEGNAYDLYELSEAVSAHGEYPSEENAIGKNNYEQYINNDQLAVAEYAAYYFARLQALWDEDNGEMWGIPLHSPLVIVCTETSTVVANRPDLQRQFAEHYIDGIAVYIGPQSIPLSRMERRGWGGEIGVWVPLQLMQQTYTWYGTAGFVEISERNLMQIMHYVMHALQPRIMNVHGATSHLLTGEGRIYYHLEINALIHALTVGDRESAVTAIHDALSFRNIRNSLYNLGTVENEMKLVEGTAVYTEMLLVMGREKINGIAKNWLLSLPLHTDDQQVALTYGYMAGALYCILLDDFEVDWRLHVGPNTDLGYILQEALGIMEFTPFNEIDVERYGYSEIAELFR